MAMPHAVSAAQDQDDLIMVPFGTDFPEIREGVRAICRRYPDKYWRDLEDADEYAEEFVAELSRAGYLGALIPEEYGGAGLPIRGHRAQMARMPPGTDRTDLHQPDPGLSGPARARHAALVLT